MLYRSPKIIAIARHKVKQSRGGAVKKSRFGISPAACGGFRLIIYGRFFIKFVHG